MSNSNLAADWNAINGEKTIGRTSMAELQNRKQEKSWPEECYSQFQPLLI